MKIEDIVRSMRANPKNIRFVDLVRVCDSYFGAPRQTVGSHRVDKMAWPGDPRVNIQDVRGFAKPYQVRQVLSAIERMEAQENEP